MSDNNFFNYVYVFGLILLSGCINTDNPSNLVESEPVFSFTKIMEADLPNKDLTGIESSDINGDGWMDLVSVSDETNVLGILEASAENNFTIVLDTMGVHSCCYSKVVFIDLNDDEFPEAIVTNAGSSGGMHILTNQQTGRFLYQESIVLLSPSAVQEIITADFSGDNRPDVAINRNFGRTSIFLNHGSGGLSEEIEIVTPDNGMYTYMGLTAGDFDNNQTMDLAHVSENGIFISFLSPDSDDLLQDQIEIKLDHFSRSIIASDINSDGYPDIITSNKLLINNGDGRNFNIVDFNSIESPTAVSATDINQDGFIDIIIAESVERKLYLLKNNGDETFTLDHTISLEQNLTVGGHKPIPYTILTDDLNGDSLPDISVSSFFSSKVFIFINESDL